MTASFLDLLTVGRDKIPRPPPTRRRQQGVLVTPMTIAAELPRLVAIGLSGALLLASAIGGAIAVEPTTAQDKTEWLRTDTGRLRRGYLELDGER